MVSLDPKLNLAPPPSDSIALLDATFFATTSDIES